MTKENNDKSKVKIDDLLEHLGIDPEEVTGASGCDPEYCKDCEDVDKCDPEKKKQFSEAAGKLKKEFKNDPFIKALLGLDSDKEFSDFIVKNLLGMARHMNQREFTIDAIILSLTIAVLMLRDPKSRMKAIVHVGEFVVKEMKELDQIKDADDVANFEGIQKVVKRIKETLRKGDDHAEK